MARQDKADLTSAGDGLSKLRNQIESHLQLEALEWLPAISKERPPLSQTGAQPICLVHQINLADVGAFVVHGL